MCLFAYGQTGAGKSYSMVCAHPELDRADGGAACMAVAGLVCLSMYGEDAHRNANTPKKVLWGDSKHYWGGLVGAK